MTGESPRHSSQPSRRHPSLFRPVPRTLQPTASRPQACAGLAAAHAPAVGLPGPLVDERTQLPREVTPLGQQPPTFALTTPPGGCSPRGCRARAAGTAPKLGGLPSSARGLPRPLRGEPGEWVRSKGSVPHSAISTGKTESSPDIQNGSLVPELIGQTAGEETVAHCS